ncbi:MAG: lactate utilization protein [Desulfobacteraceae bacterium]
MLESTPLHRLFRTKAEAVSAIVKEATGVKDAIAYALDICNQKEACTILPSGCQHNLSEKAQALCDGKPAKLIAAPDLSQPHWEILSAECDKAGIGVIKDGLRNHLGGIDIGITWAQFGIAETGTLVIDSTDEDLRLTTMISEIHIAFLPLSGICESAADIVGSLQSKMKSHSNYLAMVTGASRTADIERVLALGVHGPLEMHIVLIRDEDV